MKKGRKKKKRGMSMPLILAMGVCVIVLAVSIWQLSSIFLEYKAGTDEYEKLQDTFAPEEPSEVNEDDGEKDDGTAD